MEIWAQIIECSICRTSKIIIEIKQTLLNLTQLDVIEFFDTIVEVHRWNLSSIARTSLCTQSFKPKPL